MEALSAFAGEFVGAAEKLAIETTNANGMCGLSAGYFAGLPLRRSRYRSSNSYDRGDRKPFNKARSFLKTGVKGVTRNKGDDFCYGSGLGRV